MEPDKKPFPWGWFFGALAFGAPLVVYLGTVAPTITFEDSPELTAAAASLGIPHQPGYPLEAVLGRLFIVLVPGGPIPWRVNLLSAVTAAGAAWMLFVVCRRLFLELREDRFAAAAAAGAAALALAFGRTLWSQAVITEVYSTQALLLITFLGAAAAWVRTADARWFAASAFVAGLACVTHQGTALYILPIAIYMVTGDRPRPRRGVVFGAAVLFLLALSIYFYLTIRASHDASFNWGNPSSGDRFWGHITRRDSGGVRVGRLSFVPDHWLELGKLVWTEMTPLGLAVAAAGVAWAAAKPVRPWPQLAVLTLAAGPAATVFLVGLLQVHQLPGIRVWYLPFFILLAAFFGYAVFRALGSRRLAMRIGAGVTAAAALAAAAGGNWRSNDFRGYRFTYDFGANYLRTVGYKGITVVLERGSAGIGEIWFFKVVEGRRPDHYLADLTGAAFRDYEKLVGDEKARRLRSGPRGFDREGLENAAVEFAAVRPVYYFLYRPELFAAGYRLVPEGILFRVYRKPPAATGLSPVWRRYVMRGVAALKKAPDTPFAQGDEAARSVVLKYDVMLAQDYLRNGDRAKALELLGATGPLTPRLYFSLVEIGNVYFLMGDYDDAVAAYDAAYAAVPHRGPGDDAASRIRAHIAANKGLVLLAAGDIAGAEEAYTLALENGPAGPGETEPVRREDLERLARELRRDRR